jgi:hypothetical protein
MMRRKPLRARPRRGAWWGSRRRRAKLGAAACLVVIAVTLAAPGPASAYPCDDSATLPKAPPTELWSRTLYASPGPEGCRVPEEDDRGAGRTRKRGSMSGLTVFVLAVGAMLLIPIGRRGIPQGADPYGHDQDF